MSFIHEGFKRRVWVGTAIAAAAAACLMGAALSAVQSSHAQTICPESLPFGTVPITVYFCGSASASEASFTFNESTAQGTLSTNDTASLRGTSWSVDSSVTANGNTLSAVGSGNGADGSVTVTAGGVAKVVVTHGKWQICLVAGGLACVAN